jgi:NAD(P)-dependent dehydrogenase (short-subunit alcohol dehydrogenase family)
VVKASGGAAISVVADRAARVASEAPRRTRSRTWGNVLSFATTQAVGGGWSTACGTSPAEDWDWVLGVNFQGVLHGIRHFVPRMLAKRRTGHIVNTRRSPASSPAAPARRTRSRSTASWR